jgi:molybdate transport system substrate-binding protein
MGSISCEKNDSSLEVRLFAAASLEPALTELAKRYQKKTQAEVLLNCASSDALAEQLVSTGAADVFFPADERSMERVSSRHLIENGSRRPLLTNALVVIAAHGSALRIRAAQELSSSGFTHFVIADPDAVPQGRYARQWLQSISLERKNLWDGLRAKMVFALDARAAISMVRADPLGLGIAYTSDLAMHPEVRAVFHIPESEQPKIVYPIALVAGRPHAQAARALFQYLISSEARDVYRRHGFGVLPSSGRTP